MSVVLDLGANIECSSKNLIDFTIMGSSLYTSLYPNETPNVALLNIGSEELKGNEIIDTDKTVKSTDSPLEAAKRGKTTSMWLAIESVKHKETDIVISAGNTGALLVISKLNLDMIENIDKPALSALWPNKRGMSVVLDLGANIECNSKNLLDFTIMGSSLYTSLYPDDLSLIHI